MKKHLVILTLVAAVTRLPAQIEVVSGGNVGVGTASPGTKLSFGANNSAQIISLYENGNTKVVIGTNDGFTFGIPNTSNNNFKFGYVSTSDGTTFTELMRLTQTGNVGIGTTSPGSRRLNVQSSNSTNDVGVEIGLSRTTGTNYALIVSANGGGAAHNQGILTTAANGSSNYGLRIVNVAAGSSNYALYSDSAAQSYFQGNVGIGTTTPSQKLQVAGAVRATSFISDTTTYADFVFSPGYNLPALSEVEAHIKEHGHLPGIPSEAEAREHGIDLTAMQVKLLQKVEELTLHVIAQEKRLSAQQDEIRALRNQLNVSP